MGFFSATDCTRLYYQDWGSGEAVVFLHSWFLHTGAWEDQFHALVEGCLRCVGHDRRGRGRSDPPGGGYDSDTLAEDLAVLLETLDLRDVTLFGHSMGGGEIVRYLSRHGPGGPYRFGRDVVVGDARPRAIPRRWTRRPTRHSPTRYGRTARGSSPRGAGVFRHPSRQPGLGRGHRHDAGAGSPHVVARGARVLRLGFHAGFRAKLSRLDVPTLVVHGTGDVNNPVEMTGRRTAALVPKAQHKEYDNAAHGLFMTHVKPDPGGR